MNFRSVSMKMVRITMQREAAHDVVEALGGNGLMQFYDLSPDVNAFQRQHAQEILRCKELERVLEFFRSELEEAEMETRPDFLREIENEEQFLDLSLDNMEETFHEYESKLREVNNQLNDARMMRNRCFERMYVITEGSRMFRRDVYDEEIRNEEEEVREEDSMRQHLITSEGPTDNIEKISINVDHQAEEEDEGEDEEEEEVVDDPEHVGRIQRRFPVIGLIPRSQLNTFIVLVTRASRGNAFIEHSPIKKELFDNASKEYVKKNVFGVSDLGSQVLREKILRICDSLGASTYKLPTGDPNLVYNEQKMEIIDLDRTIAESEVLRLRTLGQLFQYYGKWKIKISRERAIYESMNLFNHTMESSVFCEGWIPASQLKRVRAIIEEADKIVGSQVDSFVEELKTEEEPPTHFDTVQYTESPQDIVCAYGIPRYKEVNPAYFSLVTFPFLFAVMYGDCGHGSIMTLVALCIIIFQKRLKKMAETSDLFQMVYHGRFVILMMGLFSIYTGIGYNDMFSLSFNVFGSSYEFNENNIGSKYRRTIPFGVDPAWFRTENKLTFYNSLKMKLAVILGVCQMLIGISFSALNHLYFKRPQDVLFEYIPMFLILSFSFGYMCFMIIYKWNIEWYRPGFEREPPALLNTMTSFFMNFWALQEPPLFTSGTFQLILQMFLLLVWACCIPCLLCCKPCFLIFGGGVWKCFQWIFKAIFQGSKKDYEMMENPSDGGGGGGDGSYGETEHIISSHPSYVDDVTDGIVEGTADDLGMRRGGDDGIQHVDMMKPEVDGYQQQQPGGIGDQERIQSGMSPELINEFRSSKYGSSLPKEVKKKKKETEDEDMSTTDEDMPAVEEDAENLYVGMSQEEPYSEGGGGGGGVFTGVGSDPYQGVEEGGEEIEIERSDDEDDEEKDQVYDSERDGTHGGMYMEKDDEERGQKEGQSLIWGDEIGDIRKQKSLQRKRKSKKRRRRDVVDEGVGYEQIAIGEYEGEEIEDEIMKRRMESSEDEDKKKKKEEEEEKDSSEEDERPKGGHDDHGTWDEIVIHQLIHTIEFVIGTVSHTASYLRLWALSLAHAQLSEVFWSMTIGLVLEVPFDVPTILEYMIVYSGIGICVGFIAWLLLTVAVLLMMEALSALLHALRLHWVEFQSKFFYGDGELFVPFVIKDLSDAEKVQIKLD